MMTVGEQRHMAIVESSLRRIADALEIIAKRLNVSDWGQIKRSFENGKIRMSFRHTDPDYKDERVEYNIYELLDYINADHSSDWTDYDKSDWEDGMNNWTDLKIDWELTEERMKGGTK